VTVGTLPKRRSRAAQAPPAPLRSARGWVWALLQLAVIAGETFAILFLLAQPGFRPQHVEIVGTAHVTAAEVTAALALPADRNIFFLRQGELERRVEGLPWVRSAAVSLGLPDRLRVNVTEWKPSAVLQVGEATYYLNDLGEVLDPAAEAGPLPIISRPDFGRVRDGQQAVAGELLPMLLQLRSGFTSAFKLSVMSFKLDRRDVLSAQTDRGWAIIFGQMATPDDRATLEPKLAALRALGGRIDLATANIAYVNLENPRAPAVQMRGKR
jgi:cell division septal protein FtsQ